MNETSGLPFTDQVVGTEPDLGRRAAGKAFPLTLSVADYDRTRPLLDSKVRPRGIAFKAMSGEIGDFCLRPVYEEYNAAEMSLSWYVIALPVFPLRM
jgi:hypothetical protein